LLGIRQAAALGADMDTIHQQNFGDRCIVASFRPDWIAAAKAIALKLAQAARAHFVHPCWERFEHPSSLLTPDWMAYVRQADLGIICSLKSSRAAARTARTPIRPHGIFNSGSTRVRYMVIIAQ